MALRAIRLNRDPVLYRKCLEVEQVDDKVRQPVGRYAANPARNLQRRCDCGSAGGCAAALGGNRYGRIKRRCAQIGQSQNHPQAGQTGVRRGLPEFSRPMGARRSDPIR